jgi:AcrR family transcriptional regulator
LETELSEPSEGQQRPELRTAILEAATRMFLDRPFAEVRVDDIAEDAGVAKGLLFYYFKNKRGIYVAVVESLLMQLVESAKPDFSLPPREREVAAVESFVRWASEVEGVEVILSRWSGGDVKTEALFREALSRVIGQMVAAMGDMPGGPGSPNGVPVPLLSRSIWGWLAFTRVTTADWLKNRDTTLEEHRDLLVAALDGIVSATRRLAEEKR